MAEYYVVYRERTDELDCRLRAQNVVVFADSKHPPVGEGYRMRKAWPGLVEDWQKEQARQSLFKSA